MLRTRLSDALKVAMKAKEGRAVSTLRLIHAGLKDRDIAARSNGNMDGIGDDDILSLFQSMVKQRRESIDAYQRGGRMELAQKEAEEISIIENFLPEQMAEEQIAVVISEVITKIGASNLKDMGKVMAVLKETYAGCMDFGKASGLVKARLG
jgi:uncharacterized protein YqeY